MLKGNSMNFSIVSVKQGFTHEEHATFKKMDDKQISEIQTIAGNIFDLTTATTGNYREAFIQGFISGREFTLRQFENDHQ